MYINQHIAKHMHDFDWIDVYNHTNVSLELSAAVCIHPFAS